MGGGELTASPAPPPPVGGDDDGASCTTDVLVCFVLDGSGSMGGYESQVRSFVTESVSKLGLSDDGSKACIVSFSDSASTLSYLTASQDQLVGAMDEYSTSGLTNIGAGLTLAGNILTSAYLPRLIVLLSDGDQSPDYGNSDAAIATAATFKAMGISIFAVGFAGVSLNTLTEISSGSSYVIHSNSLASATT